MRNVMLSRLVFYPLIWATVAVYFFNYFPDNFFVQLSMEGKRLYLSGIPDLYFPMVYGISFGYIYGTISILLKIRKLNGGLTMAFGFLFKIFITAIFASAFGYFAYAIEVVLVTLFLITRFFITLPKRKPKVAA